MTGHDGQRGFTLIELVVVIALLALVAAIAAPAAGRLFDLSSSVDDAKRLAMAMRQARMTAISEGQPQSVHIDPVRRRWRHGDSVGTFDGAASISAVVPPAGRRLNGVSAIVFLPDGSATGGRIVLGEGHRQQSVAVDWLTGTVSIAGP